MMKRTCCALTRLDPSIVKVPSEACCVGWPGGGNVVDWACIIPKKREEMYSKDKEEKVPIDKGKERKERKKGVEMNNEGKRRPESLRHNLNRLAGSLGRYKCRKESHQEICQDDQRSNQSASWTSSPALAESWLRSITFDFQ